ncbi:MAG: Uma2 family endonuclease [Chloroflexi bacterium]|nr:Uma2 family endonuclease [Chloroflexota bacterium]
MSEQTPITLPAGPIVATDVSETDYLATYASDFHEWVNGVVIKMSPASRRHDLLTTYIRGLLDTYFSFNPIGKAVSAPFVMRLEESIREPDVQVVLNDNPGDFSDTDMIGPADICIEIVSPESIARDHGEKYREYEQAGVKEYWIIDPIHREARFLRLENNLYLSITVDDDYATPLLPDLKIHVPTLWQDSLPDPVMVVEMVKAMVGK